MKAIDRLAKQELTRKEFLTLIAVGIASVTGIIGLIEQLSSHATTPTASLEPETGSPSSDKVSITTDTTASGGKAIKFGGGQQQAEYTRPTGAGYYPIEKYNTTDLQVAFNAIANDTSNGYYTVNGGNGRSLTLPEGIYQAADFTQGRVISGNTYQGFTFLAPKNVGLVGSGPNTSIQTVKNSMTVATAQAIKSIPDLQNNNFYTLGFNHADYCEIGQFTCSGVAQNTGNSMYPGLYYNGFRDQYSQHDHVFDVWVKGYGGYLNSPPGETYAFESFATNYQTLDRIETDGRDPDTGVAVSAIGISGSSVANSTYNDCTTLHTGYSHGTVFWHCNGITTNNHTSQYTGTGAGAGGGGGTTGAAINHESTQNTHHNNVTAGHNTFCTFRYYSDGSVITDTTGHYVNGLTLTDAGSFLIDMGNKQTTRPQLTNCPTPTYEALGY